MKSSFPGCLVVLLALASAHGGDSTTNTRSGLSPTFTNSLGMEFVLIQPATFINGSSADPKPTEIGSLDYDQPAAHKVTLTKPFYILKSPLSEQAYNQSALGGSAHDISWNEAAAFCSWLSEREPRKYRLPTEAEWDCVFQ